MSAWLVCLTLLTLSALLLSSGPVKAQNSGRIDPHWSIPQLMAKLAQTHHGEADFVEKKYIAALNAPIISSGQLKYHAPNYLEQHIRSPKNERMILKGDVMTLTRGDRTYTLHLSDDPRAVAYAASIRGILGGNLDLLIKSYRLRLTGSRQHWTLLLQPDTEQVAQFIDIIKVTGTNNLIQSIEYKQTDGDRTIMTMTPRHQP